MTNSHSQYLLSKKLGFSKFTSFLNSKNSNAYCSAIAIVAICSLIGCLIFPRVDTSNLIMLYLLGVVIVATLESQHHGPAILAALLSTLAFDFFFVPPYLSFNVSDIQYLFTLIVMLVVTQIISHLTVRVQRHSEATRKAKMQAESERLRNILLTSISHDLRTPLAAIMGSASSLLQPDDKLDEHMRYELAKNIYDESKRLNRLVTNVLQVIRLESRTVKITKQPHSIEEIVSNVLDRLAEWLTNKPLSVQIAKNVPLVPLDHILIEQVLINLLENAIKYSPADTPIEISARLSGKNILVKVVDHGPGLDLNDIDHIFNKFYRGKQSETNDDGFGLGLAICKNIIQAHGGKIWAENRNKGGAMFYFTLPMVE